MISSLNIGLNSSSVHLGARHNIQIRAAHSRDPLAIKEYFNQPSAQLSMIEFETIYQRNIKEFIYLAMINDFNSDEIASWIDQFKYSRSLPAIKPSELYHLEVIDETAGNEDRYSFSVEVKVILNQASGIDVASTFLKNGYCFTKDVVRRDARIGKFYYKHMQPIIVPGKNLGLVAALTKLVQEKSPDLVRTHHAKLILKINYHFASLEETSAVFNQVMDSHFKRKSVDQLKAFLASEKSIGNLVSTF